MKYDFSDVEIQSLQHSVDPQHKKRAEIGSGS